VPFNFRKDDAENEWLILKLIAFTKIIFQNITEQVLQELFQQIFINAVHKPAQLLLKQLH